MEKNNVNILSKLLSYIFVSIFFMVMHPTLSYANDEFNKKFVKVGYYENENFQEGVTLDSIKTGYSYEYLQKISSINGWKYEYVYGSWADLYEAFIKGDIDLLAGLGYSENRTNIINYPNYPMGHESYYLFVRGDDSSVNSNLSNFSGKKIGTIPGLMEKVIKEWLDTNKIQAEVIQFRDISDRDNALLNGKIDAFIGEGLSVGAKENLIPLIKIKNVNMYLCVTKVRTDLLEELNEALSEIESKEPYYLNDLAKKYFINNAVNLHVSEEEENWLKNHNYTIRVGYLEDFLPYSATDENGNPIGIMVDVLNNGFSKIKTKKTIKFEYFPYKSTQDMINAIHKHEIETMFPVSDDIYFLEKNDLFPSNEVITSAINFVYYKELPTDQTPTIAINKNNLIAQNYAAKYLKNAKIKYFDSTSATLDAILEDEVNGTILSGLRVNILLKASDYSDFSYIELPDHTTKCFGISNSHKGFLPLLNKALDSLNNNEELTYTYKYLGNAMDYSVKEFFKRNSILISLLALLIISSIVIVIAIDRVKTKKQQLYYEFAYKDGLTKLFNRRAYDEALKKFEQSMPKDLICVSMDLTRLKAVNDNLGHSAGDELINEAGRLISESLGKYGSIFRTGGDEYYGLLRASLDEFKKAKGLLDDLCSNWKGTYSDEMKIAVGAAQKSDFNENSNIMDICKLADKRMYEDKSNWYKTKGIYRRGSTSAQDTLYKTYPSTFKINISNDTCVPIKNDNNQQPLVTEDCSKASELLSKFGKSDNIHKDDLDQFMKFTDLSYLKAYFIDNIKPLSIIYRRKFEGEYKQVIMEITIADDYDNDNQNLFLYAKFIN